MMNNLVPNTETVVRFLAEEDHHDDHDEHSEEGNLRTLKIVVLFAILFSGCFVFFPYLKVVKDKKNGCCKGQFFSMLTCFAAGMLLAISLAHILPEANALYADYLIAHEAEEAAHDDHRRLAEEDHDEHEEEGHGAKFPLP